MITFENLRAPHQIVLRTVPDNREFHSGAAALIGVSCTCLRIPRRGRIAHEIIEARPAFPAAEAVAAWTAWHAARGTELA